MDSPDYEPEPRVTPEQISASVIVAGSIIGAFFFGGYVLAIRASGLFMVPLTMIWLPDILIRVATLDAKWNRQFAAPATQFSIRMVAWFVILGVPTAWLIFSLLQA